MTTLLLHHKVELALVAWLEANRGDALAGVTIIPGHSNAEPALPFLAIYAGKALVHPDFDGCGRRYPQLVPVVGCFRENSKDATHSESVGLWLAQLDELFAARLTDGTDYSALIAALNPPPPIALDDRPQKNLFIYAIHPGDDAGEVDGLVWEDALILEIVAQNGDPDPDFTMNYYASNTAKLDASNIAPGTYATITGEGNRIEQYLGGDPASEASWKNERNTVLLEVDNGTGSPVIVNGVSCPTGQSTSVDWCYEDSVPLTGSGDIDRQNSSTCAITLDGFTVGGPFALPFRCQRADQVTIVLGVTSA